MNGSPRSRASLRSALLLILPGSAWLAACSADGVDERFPLENDPLPADIGSSPDGADTKGGIANLIARVAPGSRDLTFIVPAKQPLSALAYSKLSTDNESVSGYVSAQSTFVAYCDATTKLCTDTNGATVANTSCPGWTTASTTSAYCWDVQLLNGYASTALAQAHLVVNDMTPQAGYEPLNSETSPGGSGLSSPYGLWNFGTVPARTSITVPGVSSTKRWTFKYVNETGFEVHFQSYSDTCASTQILCGSTCVNYLTDANNCGSCGQVCGALSTCTSGVCSYVNLASSQAGVIYLSLATNDVVWGLSGALRKVSKTPAVSPIITNLDAAATNVGPTAVANGVTALYRKGSNVTSIPVAGGATVNEGAGAPTASIVTDGTFVYWLEGNTLKRSTVGTGGITSVTLLVTILPVVANAGSLATDGTFVYIGEVPGSGTTAGRLIRVPVAGGVATSIATASITSGTNTCLGISDLSVDSTNVYWVDQCLAGRIMKTPSAGGASTAIAAGQACPYSLAADSTVSPTFVYWTNDTSPGAASCNSTYTDGTINRVSSTAGATVQTLVTAQTRMDDIAVDNTAVFWTAVTDGNIRRFLKPTTSTPTATPACNPNVLILRDNTAGTLTNINRLTTALTAVGITSTVEPANSIVNGTTQTLTNYGAVFLLTGDDSTTTNDLNATTQTNLKNAVTDNRVGLVLTGGAATKRANSRWVTLDTLILARGSGNTSFTTPRMQHVAPPQNEWRWEFFQKVPETFQPTGSGNIVFANTTSITNSGLDAGAIDNGSGTAYKGVVVRDNTDGTGRGRIAQLGYYGGTTGATVGGAYFQSTPNDFTRLTMNSIRWAARCL